MKFFWGEKTDGKCIFCGKREARLFSVIKEEKNFFEEKASDPRGELFHSNFCEECFLKNVFLRHRLGQFYH